MAGALLVHVVLGLRLTGQALDWVAGRRARPRRLLFAYMACGFAGAAIAALVLVKLPDDPPATYYTACVGTYVLFLAFSCGLGVLALRTHRQSLVAVAVATFGGWLLGSALLPAPAAAALALSTLLSAGGLTLASRFSIWLLQAVYELDEARHTRARLAVAEERLRFGRDLHDVLGRNLSVIALKSELAVQLARRERPEAVEQMAEVQRIAQESQREVREVVRGYREADLYTELLGARGVLSAAGITCTVTGTPTGLPRPVQAALAWVVREAVTNVLRHGNAAHCRIALTVVPAGPGPRAGPPWPNSPWRTTAYRPRRTAPPAATVWPGCGRGSRPSRGRWRPGRPGKARSGWWRGCPYRRTRWRSLVFRGRPRSGPARNWSRKRP